MRSAALSCSQQERQSPSRAGLLRDLTAKGQSIHAAMANNPDRFVFSLKTAYRYVNAGLLSTKRGDLPRACALKPRKGKGVEHRVDKTCRVGRTWEDYLKFIGEHPGVRVVEMGTVEGVKGGKLLLTLAFNPFNFMLAFLVDAKTSECVLGVFEAIVATLRERYGEDGWREVFARLFPVILTDNGTEFSTPARIESDADGGRLLLQRLRPLPEGARRTQPRVHPPRPAEGHGLHGADTVRRPLPGRRLADDVARQLLRPQGPRGQDALRPLHGRAGRGDCLALRNIADRGQRRHPQAIPPGHRGQGEGKSLAEGRRSIRKEVADRP